MDWSGEPVDLDGDGIAQESLWEECLAGEHLGLLVPENHIIEWTLRPIYSCGHPRSMGFPFFHGDYPPGVETSYYYSLHLITGEMQILEDGTLDQAAVETALKESDYEALPKDMRQVAQEAKETLLQTRDGQLCDAIIDRAALEAVRKAGAASGEKLLKDYGELICATGDIKIAVRCARCGKDRSFLMKALAPCDSLDIELLADAATSGVDAICAYLDHTDYADAVDELKKSVAAFERWCDNRMIETIRPEIHNPFGIGPIAAYILARENEIRTVRIILAAKRNNLPEEMLRERVRVMYV
jgi:V/A-type H+-transporting ATPase subunit C